MGPSKIMLIRHAEKPIAGRVQGMRARGAVDDSSLTAVGWQRAGALVSFFEKPRSPHLACPDHLLAVRYDLAIAGSSRRSKQTVSPLAQALGMRVDDRFGEGQEDKLARAVEQLAGTVLIAWSHEKILKIVANLGLDAATPAEWPDDRFDLVWVFARSVKKTTFVQVPQLLLAGDSIEVFPVAGRS